MSAAGSTPDIICLSHLRWNFVFQRPQHLLTRCRWITRAGRRALSMPGDLTDERYCMALVDVAHDQFGRLDLLVNNAGFQRSHETLAEFTTEELERTFRTNVYAMFWLCRAALPRMQPGGCIINTASTQAFDPSPALLLYAATKAAIVSFTKGLAQIALKSPY
jgi:NAD(P)-dependent dehydrogenase (short-subunit alcohol dehydrogenase family)